MTAVAHRSDHDGGDPCFHLEDWGRVKSDMVYIKTALDRIIQQTDGMGARVRALEDYRNRQVGAMALIGGLCGLVGALLVKLVFWAITARHG